MTRVRQGEDEEVVRVTRGIPLPWLLTVVVTFIFSAGVIYAGIQEQTRAISELSGMVKALSAQLATKDLKDIEHDARLAEHDRRFQDLDSRLRSVEANRR